MLQRYLLLFLLFPLASMVQGQRRAVSAPPGVAFTGTVAEKVGGVPIPSGTVTLSDLEDSTFVIDFSIRSGKYEFYLPYDRQLLVLFEAPGLVQKSVEVNTKGVGAKQIKGGFAMIMDVVLIKPLDGVDYSILDQPFGKAAYDPRRKVFVWDMTYTRLMRDQQQKLMDDHARRSRELGHDE